MGGILIILALVGSVVAWVIGGVNAFKRGANAGMKFYFINLGLCILLIGLLFALIVVPSMGCHGFLCGLGAILLFFLIAGLVFLIWPLILIPVINSKFQPSNTTSDYDSDLIDNI